MTYAGAYGRHDRLPVDRVLRRESHPLGVRRAEATKAATEEPESNANHKRWALGAAAGALLVAGTFAASALGLSGGATTTAGSAPEHAPAAPGHTPGNGPVVGAPAPGQEDQQAQPQDQQPQSQGTTAPSSTNPRAGVPVDTGTGTGTPQAGGENQRTPGTTTPTTPSPTTPPSSTTPPSTTTPEDPAPPAGDEDQGGGGLGETVGDVLEPVTDVVGGILSPSSASSSDTSTTKAAPAGPALSMIDPLGTLLATP